MVTDGLFIGMGIILSEIPINEYSSGGHKARHYIHSSGMFVVRFLMWRIEIICERYYFFLNPVKIQITPQAIATGQKPKYRNGFIARCQGSK